MNTPSIDVFITSIIYNICADERVFFTQVQRIHSGLTDASAIGQYVTKYFTFINYTVLGSFKKSISLFRMQR